jgi:hypothetical protein
VRGIHAVRASINHGLVREITILVVVKFMDGLETTRLMMAAFDDSVIRVIEGRPPSISPQPFTSVL